MRPNRSPIGSRPLFAFIVMIAVLFASGVSGAATASAAMMNHDMQAMEMGHCTSAPTSHESKSPLKQCCIAMCMAVAIAPSTPADVVRVKESLANFTRPAGYDCYLGEIATPPPRAA